MLKKKCNPVLSDQCSYAKKSIFNNIMFKADFNEHRVVIHTNTTFTDKHFRTNVSLSQILRIFRALQSQNNTPGTVQNI